MRYLLSVIMSVILVTVLLSACSSTGTNSTTASTSVSETATALTTAASQNATEVSTEASTVLATVASVVGSSTQSSPVTAAQARVDSALQNVLQAMQGHDLSQLQKLMGSSMGSATMMQNAQQLMTCIRSGNNIALVDHSVTVNGNTATVNMTLKVTDANGATTTVQRQMQFNRQSDGSWAVSSLPECPL